MEGRDKELGRDNETPLERIRTIPHDQPQNSGRFS